MHIANEYIYGIHSYCRQISIYLASLYILQVNIYIYIYKKFIHIAGEYLVI